MRRYVWLFLLLVLPATPAVAAAEPPPPGLTAQKINPSSRVTAPSAATSRLAETDRSLLGRTDSTPVPVLVKLDHDPVSTYAGGVAGYAPTSPAATGRRLTGSAAERQYESYLAGREDAFVRELARKVPGAAVRQRLRTVYGGVSLTVPANRIGELLEVDGVAAVQPDTLRHKLTDASPSFVGAAAVASGHTAGKGIIVGVIDTGAWPEHPSFADRGHLGPPPPKVDGTPRACQFDAFRCNNKLIGGAVFLDEYNRQIGRERYTSARDSDGHGTHTASTAAGNALSSAKVFGVERGPLHGVAPGAWISVYKALGAQGGYSSDLAAAVGQAVKDGVHVINYSVSGGKDPYTDPVEMAFLDAYAAGVFVAASAGNSGPGASTTEHVSPWVTTVAASTQTRQFTSTLTLRSKGETLTLTGASVTGGVTEAAPVVLAESVPGYAGGAACQKPASPGLFAGKIVACQRGVNARVEKGYHVVQGGALGMILYNPAQADVNSDNHWLPTVHLADGARLTAFLKRYADATGTFTAGRKTRGKGDVMAAFSSRGPGGLGIKPDLTAPGVQILAGTTPTPDAVEHGPPGQYFQAIPGTSMSAPHVAGAAALLKARHPDWTPGQIKSALMTTARTDVVKEDQRTPADPFDLGSGRVDLTRAGNPGLTLDESAGRMAALGDNPVAAIHLNLPSVNAPVMPGRVTTIRTVSNVTDQPQTYAISASAPAKSRITVSPSRFTVRPGRSVALRITISSTAPTAQYFGQVRLDPDRSGLPTLHLPVAFVPKQGDVTLTSTCTPESVRWAHLSTCTITATNESFGDTTATLRTETNGKLHLSGDTKRTVTLAGRPPGTPSVAPGNLLGYAPLRDFKVTPDPIGDEEIVNYPVPKFVYNGQTYSSVGVSANGYLVVGGATADDNVCCDLPDRLPDPARPNNLLAPFWTNLTGDGAEGVRVSSLTHDDGRSWVVVEWQVNVAGTTSNRHFQVWLGTGARQDITFAYDPAARPAAPGSQPFLIGAENADASGGHRLPAGALPTGDLRVISTEPPPGGSASYTVQVRGLLPGTGKVTTSMTSPAVPGTTVVTATVRVSM